MPQQSIVEQNLKRVGNSFLLRKGVTLYDLTNSIPVIYCIYCEKPLLITGRREGGVVRFYADSCECAEDQ